MKENRGVIIDNGIDECFSLTFAKKQNNGVTWISKEQYIRSDIKCGYINCLLCNNNSNSSVNKNKSKQSEIIFLIPDIETVVNYLEVLELNDIIDSHYLIIVETVYRHVQYNSGPKFFERLKQLIVNNRAIYFTNELFTETAIEKSEKESLSDFIQRRLITTTKWYKNHFNIQKQQQQTDLINNISIILITADQSSSITSSFKQYEKQQKQQQQVNEYYCSLNRYLDILNIQTASELYDTLSISLSEQQSSGSAGSGDNNFYDRYWNDDIMQVELKSGNIIAGKIHINQYNRDQAFVKLPSDSIIATKMTGYDKIMIIGRKHINRAIHGDKVGIALLPEDQWISSSSNSLLEDDLSEQQSNDNEDINNNNEDQNKIIKKEKKNNNNIIITGKVVGIFQRNWRDYVATMETNAPLNSNHVMAVPLDMRIPVIRVATKNASAYAGKRLVVRVDRWDLTSTHPAGHIVSALGKTGDLETELMALINEHEVALPKWTPQLLEGLPTPGWKVPDSERKYRRSLVSSHRTMSIDPLGSQDIDDAISLGYLPDKKCVEIGVHIADVSFFVRDGSKLDEEARRRGTTLYLPDRRFDMLPAILSEDVCSLRGGQERCAMSVVWTVNLETMSIENTWFGRTIIFSCAELHYQLAQDIIDGRVRQGMDKDEHVTNGGANAGYKNRVHNNVTIDEIKADLMVLRNFYRVMRKQREMSGGLDLESIEVRFKFNANDKTQPEKIVLKNDLEVHSLVAEYMILANASVGTKIHSHYPGSALLRRHPKPNQLGFESLRDLFDLCGFKLDTSTNKELADSLNSAKDKDDPFTNTIIRLKTVNILSEAIYFSTGSLNVIEYYHYGLALDKYTHFTSPIRRYADIIVHRQLWDAIKNVRNEKYQDHPVAKLAEHLNIRHRASKTLQRDATQMFQSLYFKHHPKENVEAIITDIRSNAIVVYIPEFGLRDRIYLLSKENGYIVPTSMQDKHGAVKDIQFEPLDVQLVFEKETIKLQVFDHILVNITTAQNDYHIPPIKIELVQIMNRKQRNHSIKNEMMNNKKLVDQIKTKQDNNDKDKKNNNSDIYGQINSIDSIVVEKKSEDSMYDLINKFSVGLKIIEECGGSKINYSKGKLSNNNKQIEETSPNTKKPSTTTTTSSPSVAPINNNKVLKLWSMNDNQAKDYRTKTDRAIRDAISNKYRLMNKEIGIEEEESNEKITPNQTVNDRYKDVINRAEQSFSKAQRDLYKSRKSYS